MDLTEFIIANNEKKIELNTDILNKLKERIYIMEKENHKTKKFKDNEMVDKIRRLIEAEVDQNDN